MIVLKFILQIFVIHPEYELHRDEFLHLDQANHLAWGYRSIPPFTSWVSLLIKSFGNSVFWVKFFPALFGALTLFVVWKTIEALGGGLYAMALGSMGIVFSALLRINSLYQPNSADFLFWTVAYYTVVRLIQSQNSKWLYALAITLAIGFLNKYNIVFLALGLLPAILLTPHRSWLANKHLYYALFTGLLLVSPNLLWQYQNNWPVVSHLNELSSSQLANVKILDFVSNQFLFFLGSVPIILAALFALLFHRPFKNLRLYFFAYLFTISTFIFFKAKGYYAIGLYPILLAFGSVYFERILERGKFKLLKFSLLSLPILTIIPLFLYAFPFKSPAYIVNNPGPYRALGLLTWEDGQAYHMPQDFADMLGWKELAKKVDLAIELIDDPTNTLILCDNYGQAGGINFYSQKGLNAVSFSADYIDWFELNKPYDHIIRVKNAWEIENEMEETKSAFEKAELYEKINHPYAREKGTGIFIFQGAKVDINERLRQEIHKELNQ